MHEVHIPKVGMSTVEVDIISVDVAIGQQVSAGDTVVQVSGDKVDFEVEAGVAGTIIEILVTAGDIGSVGQVVARIQP
jgi:pyruvate/2-oxoglutarate dehydrogenase complex dihydrolipoamide acyltransferase (E2) component